MALKKWKDFLSELEEKKGSPLNAMDVTAAQRSYTDYLNNSTRFRYADDAVKAKALSYVYGISEDQLSDVNFDDETSLLKHTYRNYYNMTGTKPGEEGPLTFFDQEGNEDPRSPGLIKFDPLSKSIAGIGEEAKTKGRPVEMFLDSSGRARVARSSVKLDPETQQFYEELATKQLNAEKRDKPHGWGDIITEDIPQTVRDYAPLYLGGMVGGAGKLLGSETLSDVGGDLKRDAELRLAGQQTPFDPEVIRQDLGKGPDEVIELTDMIKWAVAHPAEGGDDVIGALLQQVPFQGLQMALVKGGEALGGAVGGIAAGVPTAGFGTVPGAAAGSRVGGAIGAVIGGASEAAMEADETFENLKAMGKTDEEALAEMQKTFGKNIIWSSLLNYASFGKAARGGVAGKGILGAITKSVIRSGAYADDAIKNSTRFQRMLAAIADNESHLAKFATKGERMAARVPFEAAGIAATVGAQGLEEWGQFGFQEEALGNGFWAQSTERNLETFLGGIGGGATDVAPRTYNVYNLSKSIDERLESMKSQYESATNPRAKAALAAQIQDLSRFSEYTPAAIDDWAQTAIASGADPDQIEMVIDEAKNGITRRAMNMAEAVSRNVNRTWEAAAEAGVEDEDGNIGVPEPLVNNLIESLKRLDSGQIPAPGGTRQAALTNVHKFVNDYYANAATPEEQVAFAQDVWQRVFGEQLSYVKAKTPETAKKQGEEFTEQIVKAEEERLGKLSPTQRAVEAIVQKHDLDARTATWLVSFGEVIRGGQDIFTAFSAATAANDGAPPALTKSQAMSLGLTEEVADLVETVKKQYDEQEAVRFASSPEMIQEKIDSLQNMLKNPQIEKKQKKKFLAEVRKLTGLKKKAIAEAKRTEKNDQANQKLEQIKADREQKRIEQENQRRLQMLEETNAEETNISNAIDALVGQGVPRVEATMRVLQEVANAGGLRENAGQVSRGRVVAQGRRGQGGTNLEQQTQGQPGGEAQNEAQTLAERLAGLRGQAGRDVQVVEPTVVVADATPVPPVVPVVVPDEAATPVVPEVVQPLTKIAKLKQSRAAAKNQTEQQATPPAATDAATPPPAEPTQPPVAPTQPPQPPTPAKPPAAPRKPPKSRKAQNEAMRRDRDAGGKNLSQALRKSKDKPPALTRGATVRVYNNDGSHTDHKVSTVEENNTGLTTVKVEDGQGGEVTLTNQAETETNMLAVPAEKAPVNLDAAFEKGETETTKGEKKNLDAAFEAATGDTTEDAEAEARHQRAVAPLVARRDEITELLKTEKRPTVIENLKREQDILNQMINKVPREVREVGTGLAAEEKRLVAAGTGETAEDKAGGEEPDTEEKAAPKEGAKTEELTAAQAEVASARQRSEAMRQRLGFEQEQLEQAQRLGNILHASGTGLGATVDPDAIYRNNNRGLGIPLLPRGAARDDVFKSLGVRDKESAAKAVYIDEQGRMFTADKEGKLHYLNVPEGPVGRKLEKLKVQALLRRAKPIKVSDQQKERLVAAMSPDMDDVAAAIGADDALLEKHGVKIRTFEDAVFVSGDSGSAFNFWQEARDRYAKTQEQKDYINNVMANLYERYFVEMGLDVNSKEYAAELEAVRNGTLPDQLEPIRYPKGVEVSNQAKAEILAALYQSGPKLAQRIKAILAANGFKNVEELNISAWMGFTGKVRLSIQAAQRREDGSWGPLSVSSKATTQEEMQELQRVVEQKIYQAILDEVGFATGEAVVVDNVGFIGEPPNWKARVEVSKNKFLPAEDALVQDADKAFHYLEPVYNSTRSKLQDAKDEINRQIRLLYSSVTGKKKVDKGLYERIQKKRDQAAKLRESGKDKLAEKVEAQIAALEESAKTTGKDKEAIRGEQWQKIQKRLAQLKAQRDEVNKKLQAERKRLKLPDYNTRAFNPTLRPSPVTEEQRDKDKTVKYKPLTRRERADQRFSLIRQLGIGAMSDEEFQQYFNDAEFRDRMDEMWRQRSAEIEASLQAKEALRKADDEISRGILTETVTSPDGSLRLTRAQAKLIEENRALAVKVAKKYGTGDPARDRDLIDAAMMGIIEGVMRLNNNETLASLERQYDAAETDAQKSKLAKRIAELRDANARGELLVNPSYLVGKAKVALLNYLADSLPMSMSSGEKKSSIYRTEEGRFASLAWRFVRDYRKNNSGQMPSREYLVNKFRNYVEGGRREYVRFGGQDLESRVDDFLTNISTATFDAVLKDEEGESSGGSVIRVVSDEYTGRGEGKQYYQLLSKEIRQLVASKFRNLTQREQDVLSELLQIKKVETRNGAKFVPSKFADEESAPEIGEVAERLNLSIEDVEKARDSGLEKLRREPDLQHLRPIPRERKQQERRPSRVVIDKETVAYLKTQLGEDIGVPVETVGSVTYLVGDAATINELLNPANFTKAKTTVREDAARARSTLPLRPSDVVKSTFSFNDANGEEVGIGDLVLVRTGKDRYGLYYVADVARRPGGVNITLQHHQKEGKAGQKVINETTSGKGDPSAVYVLNEQNLNNLKISKVARLKYAAILRADQARREERPASSTPQGVTPTPTGDRRLLSEIRGGRESAFTKEEMAALRKARARVRVRMGVTRAKATARGTARVALQVKQDEEMSIDDAQKRYGIGTLIADSIRAFEKRTGKRVVFFDNERDEVLGRFDWDSPDVLYVNMATHSAKDPEAIINTIVHEYVHSIDWGLSDAQYEALLEALGIRPDGLLLDNLLDWSRGWIPKTHARYIETLRRVKEIRGDRTVTESERELAFANLASAEHRVVAEIMAHMIGEKGFASRALDHVRESNPRLFRQVIEAIKSIVAKMKAAIFKNKIDKFAKSAGITEKNIKNFELLLDEYGRRESRKTAEREAALFDETIGDIAEEDYDAVERLPESAIPPEQTKAQASLQKFLDEIDSLDPIYWMRQARALRENQIIADANKAPAMITRDGAPTPVSIPGINDNKILSQFPGLLKTLGVIAPTAFSTQAKETARSLRSELGHAERRRAQAADILKGSSTYIEGQIAKHGAEWSRNIIRLIEDNRISDITDPTTRHIAEALRQLLDSRAEMIAAIDPNFIGELEDLDPGYFPHMFKFSQRRSAAAARRASLEGNKSFTGRRIYDTLQEGIDAGLEPVSENFVDIVTMRLAQEDRFIAAHRFMNSALANGRARWVTMESQRDAKKEREKDFRTRESEMRARLGRPLDGTEKAALRREYDPIAASGVPDDWVQIDDPIARVAGDRTKVLFMPPDAANILNNYLERSALQDVPAFQAYRNLSNFMNQLQLGWSFFHLMFTTVDAAANQLSVGLKYLVMGLSRGSFKDIRRAVFNILTSPIAGLTNLATGREIRSEYIHRGLEGGRAIPTSPNPIRSMRHAAKSAASWLGRGPAGILARLLGLGQAETGVKLDDEAFDIVINAIQRAGGAVEMDSFYRSGAKDRLKAALARRSASGVALQIVPGLTEMVSGVILENIVPGQKLGAFYQLARFELDRLGESASPEQVDEALQKAWDSVDNRMGQLVYNNLFWGKTFKDILMATFRAVGWTFGSLREGVGAFMDLGRFAGKAVKPGEKLDVANDFTHRMAYAISMPIMVMFMGSILGSALGGGNEEDDDEERWKNYLYPKTGNTDAYGNPERVQIASYMKDVFAWKDHPFQTFFHKLHPAILTAANVISGHDYLGNKITDPQDGIIERGWKNIVYTAGEYAPFSVRNMKRHIDQTGDTSLDAYLKGFLMPFFGIVPAPASAGRSDAENLAREFSAEKSKFFKDERAQERSQARARLMTKLSKGQTKFTPEELGPIGRSEVGKIRKEMKKAPILRAISSVSANEVMAVWEEMTPKEKLLARRAVITKLTNAIRQTSIKDEQDEYRSNLQQIREETRGEQNAP